MKRFPLLLAVVALPILASAQGTGLAAAPSMKVQKLQRLQTQFRVTSKGEALDSAYVRNLQFSYGPFEGVEISADSNFNGRNRLGARYMLPLDLPNDLNFTVGIFDITDERDIYFGFVKDFVNDQEIHAGYIDKSNGQAFLGYRKKLKLGDHKARFTVDHITGPSGRTSGRFDYYFNSSWAVDTRIYFPNNSSRARTHRVGISYYYQF